MQHISTSSNTTMACRTITPAPGAPSAPVPHVFTPGLIDLQASGSIALDIFLGSKLDLGPPAGILADCLLHTGGG